ncbi:MAG: SDR family oxidoreductase [Anaerolineae bacterium]|jgi:NAD(P)-dependent dehydrogenase (short-subunit alcohol dehydrogenase family)
MTRQSSQLEGKVCIVTGATSGIGLATAQALAQQRAQVIVVGRNPEKSATAVARIQHESGNPSVEFALADLSVQAQIRQLAEEFESRLSRLDVLINNVGDFFFRRQLSADGIEMTLALNYLGVYLLTNLLLDKLKASAPARVVNVSSDAHRRARIHFDDLELEHKYNGLKAYGQSKLAMVLFTYELARRLEGTGVTANALHPGFTATNIVTSNEGPLKLLAGLIKLVALPPEEGAQTSVYLASSPEVNGVTGKYFDKKRAVRSAPASYDEEAGERLWEISAQMTGL